MEELDRTLAIDPTEDDAVTRDLFQDPVRVAEPIDADLLEEMMQVLAPGNPPADPGTRVRTGPVPTR